MEKKTRGDRKADRRLERDPGRKMFYRERSKAIWRLWDREVPQCFSFRGLEIPDTGKELPKVRFGRLEWK